MNSRLRRMAVAVAAALPIVGIGMAQGAAQATTAQPVGSLPPLSCVADRHLEVGNRTVYEGTRTEANNTPYTYVSFTVTSSGCAHAGSVDYVTLLGSATAGVDYLGVSGTLYFEPGQTGVRTVTARVVKDTSPGGAETFNLYLGDPSAQVTVDDGVGVATILNDDATCAPPWDWTPPPPPLQPDYHCSE